MIPSLVLVVHFHSKFIDVKFCGIYLACVRFNFSTDILVFCVFAFSFLGVRISQNVSFILHFLATAFDVDDLIQDQLLQQLRHRHSVRWLQGVRSRPREGRRCPSRVHGDKICK